MSTVAVAICSIILIVELAFVPLYLKKMWPIKNWNSLIYKMICATGYLGLGLVCAWQTSFSGRYAQLMLFGFAFSWLGDFFLHIPKPTKLYFLIGTGMFAAAHVFYCNAYLEIQHRLFPDSPDFFWQEIVSTVLMTAAFLIIPYTKGFRLGKMFVPMVIYGSFVGMMAIKSTELAASLIIGGITADIIPAVLLLSGGILFYMSDGSLGLITFDTRYKKFKLKIFNTVTYFTAQILLAFTVVFFN